MLTVDAALVGMAGIKVSDNIIIEIGVTEMTVRLIIS